MKIPDYKLVLWFIVMIVLLFPITHIGWLVHYKFRIDYGLPFSFEWAIPYFIDEMFVVASIGIASAAGYWLLADKDVRSKVTMFLLGYTVFHQWLSGAFDWLWFIVNRIYGHPFPGLDEVWWWNPYYWAFGIEWTTEYHIWYTIIMEAILLIIWIIWIKVVKQPHT